MAGSPASSHLKTEAEIGFWATRKFYDRAETPKNSLPPVEFASTSSVFAPLDLVHAEAVLLGEGGIVIRTNRSDFDLHRRVVG